MWNTIRRAWREAVEGRPRRGRAPDYRVRPRLELLEGRDVPTAYLIAGGLYVTGMGFGAKTPLDDIITLCRQGSNLVVTEYDHPGGNVLAQNSFLVTDVHTISIQTGDGNDQVNIDSIGAPIPAQVLTNSGTDTVNICPTTQNLAAVYGSTITLDGGYVPDRLFVCDNANTAAADYAVDGGVSRKGGGVVRYSNVSELHLAGSTGSNTF